MLKNLYKMVGYLIFVVRYHVYQWITNFLKPKHENYFLFFLKGYPSNMTEPFKLILDRESVFCVSLNPGSLIIRFSSTKKSKEIISILNKMYLSEDVFFLVPEKNANKNLDVITLMNLYDSKKNSDPFESVKNLQKFIDVVNNFRDNIVKMYTENQTALGDIFDFGVEDKIEKQTKSPITMQNDIDPILDKIKIYGMDGLTDEEKIILNNYSKLL